MAVPKTKNELIRQSRDNYNTLIELIDSFTEKDQLQEFPEGTMNRNIRDVIAHLHQWHLMFLDWYAIGMKGGNPEMPAKGFSWKDTKKLNEKIWSDFQGVSLEEIRKAFNNSYSKLQRIIQVHTEEELFKKKYYKWTGSSSLGTYIRSNTSSHYNWGYQLIKKAKMK